MSDRGMIKWAPFSSVVSGKRIVDYVDSQRQKVKQPILSEEQLEIINNIIIDSHLNLNLVLIDYYCNGYIYNVRGIITTIDVVKRCIIIDYKNTIYFSQIISIQIE